MSPLTWSASVSLSPDLLMKSVFNAKTIQCLHHQRCHTVIHLQCWDPRRAKQNYTVVYLLCRTERTETGVLLSIAAASSSDIQAVQVGVLSRQIATLGKHTEDWIPYVLQLCKHVTFSHARKTVEYLMAMTHLFAKSADVENSVLSVDAADCT